MIAQAAARSDLPGHFNPTVLLALVLIAIIVMMVLPMPAMVLDIGLAISFALAILIFTVTLFIERPLDFSSFPTVLLTSLMLRLSLNVSSTKLIIGQGHTGIDAAGSVISGFASFVMGGNFFLGLVVFGVLLIVNFIVITKGAGRMAEVGARFALDGMPGKQLAIDSDIAAGAITHAEAKERRRLEQEETTFFGSLDGASKFVKGDAIAGLLITLLNLVMGITMGLTVHNLEFSQALQSYAILTVGDGLVSQIPGVIVSIATALLLSKGGVLGSADRALLTQLGSHSSALLTVSALLAVFALMPGLPLMPFLLSALGLAGTAFFLRLRARKLAEREEKDRPKATESARTLGDQMEVDEIHMEFAPNLVRTAMDDATGLHARIGNLRRHVAMEFGLIVPEIRLTDNPQLDNDRYRIRIQGVEVAGGKVHGDRVLVLRPDGQDIEVAGEDVAEPVYGAPARWVAAALRDDAAQLGYPVADANEVMATHLLETIKRNFSKLVTRRTLRRILAEFVNISDSERAAANQRLLDEFVPEPVSVELLQSVLKQLLDERISLRNLALILEAIAEQRPLGNDVDKLVEHVRQRLSFQIVSPLLEKDGALPLIQLGPAWEELFRNHEITQEGKGPADIALPPGEFNRLAGSVSKCLNEVSKSGRYAAVVTSARRRRFLRSVLSAKGIENPVLAFEEVALNATPAMLGTA
jgi:flagellar biosynthesis protein FlhA